MCPSLAKKQHNLYVQKFDLEKYHVSMYTGTLIYTNIDEYKEVVEKCSKFCLHIPLALVQNFQVCSVTIAAKVTYSLLITSNFCAAAKLHTI